MTIKTNNTKKKKENVDNFNKKLSDYLKKELGLYEVGDKSANYQNNLYKIKYDIIKKFQDDLTSFVIFSHMFRASFLPVNKKLDKPSIYRDNGIWQNIYDYEILDLIDFHIADDEDPKKIKLEFLENHRTITKKIFSVEKLNLVLDSIFQFNQPLINHAVMNSVNSYPMFNFQIERMEVDYFADISKLLINQGVKQITRHLHPIKEKNLINQLEYFSELVNRLEIPDKYSLDEIEKEKEKIRKENKN